MISLKLIRFVQVRTLLFFGHIGLGTIHVLTSLFAYNNNPVGIFVSVAMFYFVYFNTSGPLVWMYAAETVVDAGVGMVFSVLFITSMILVSISTYLLEENSVG